MSPPPGQGSGRGSRQASSVLYVTYDGLLEPLGASQVLPYVRGVRAAGHTVTVLSFEKAQDLARPGRVEALERDLAGSDIGWRRLRYHRRPTLPATAWDVVQGSRAVRRWSREGRGRRVVHARGYLPGLMGTSAADPEVLLWWALLPFGVWGGLLALRVDAGRYTVPVSVLVVVTFAYAMVESNVGTAYRHRGQILPLALIFCAIGLHELRARRAEQRARRDERRRRAREAVRVPFPPSRR